MKRKAAIVFLVMALILGAVTAWLATRWLKDQTRIAADRTRIKTQAVVVARAYIPQGVRLGRGDVRVVKFPMGAVPPGSFRSVRAVYGRVLRWSVFTGEPVLSSRLAPRGIRGGLSAIVSSNTRAVAVRVNDVIGVAGFVQPGDRVDVLVTFKQRRYRDNPVTRIIIQNVLVLAVGKAVQGGNRASRGKTAKKPRMVRAVTLQVSPEQSERLALAGSYGDVILALRNQRDNNEQETLGISGMAMVPPERIMKPRPSVPVRLTSTLDMLTRAKKKKTTTVKAKPSPRRRVVRPSVEVIMGSKVSRQSI